VSYTLQYYDLVLGAIIASVVAGGAVGHLTTVPMPIAIVGLGTVAVALIGHALFVNGPVDDLEDLTDEVEADLVEVVNPVE
jgi:hypothetical protein